MDDPFALQTADARFDPRQPVRVNGFLYVPADTSQPPKVAKPDPLAQVAREMVLLDGVVRTDNQKAAIREGRAANTAADNFYDRLRTALAARGLKLVEVGDAD